LLYLTLKNGLTVAFFNIRVSEYKKNEHVLYFFVQSSNCVYLSSYI